MLQLENSTPFATSMSLFPNKDGIDTLYLIAKASFNIGEKWILTDEQSKPVEADIYWGEPEDSSIRYASDYHIGKPGTDIIMNGHACSLHNQAVKRMNVDLQVGSISKTIAVIGDREWLNGKITEPLPFQSMPLIYENSFGGMHLIEDRIESSELRNPLGRGYAGSRSESEMNGQALPNLEDPANLIQKYTDTPEPACFGFVAPAWHPRASFVGTYDEDWQNNRAPYLPTDFNTRFLNMSHPDLIYPGYLQGGEAVAISGMHPDGDLNFNLPRIGLTSTLQVNGMKEKIDFNLETLILEPNQLQLNMVWRAAFECDKKSIKVSNIHIALKR